MPRIGRAGNSVHSVVDRKSDGTAVLRAESDLLGSHAGSHGSPNTEREEMSRVNWIEIGASLTVWIVYLMVSGMVIVYLGVALCRVYE